MASCRQRLAHQGISPVPVGGVQLAEQHHVRQGRQAAAHLLAQLFGGADLPVAPQMAMQLLQLGQGVAAPAKGPGELAAASSTTSGCCASNQVRTANGSSRSNASRPAVNRLV